MPRRNRRKHGRNYRSRKHSYKTGGRPPTIIIHTSDKRVYKIVPCPRCGCQASTIKRGLTKHHILPKRWFKENGNHFWVCSGCHEKVLEEMIRQLELERGKGRMSNLETWEYCLIMTILLKYPEDGVEELVRHFHSTLV